MSHWHASAALRLSSFKPQSLAFVSAKAASVEAPRLRQEVVRRHDRGLQRSLRRRLRHALRTAARRTSAPSEGATGHDLADDQHAG